MIMHKNTALVADNQAEIKKTVIIPLNDANLPIETQKVSFPIIPAPPVEDREPSLEGSRTKALKSKKEKKGNLYTWTSTNLKGDPITVEITNFDILPLYLLKHPTNSKRIFEIRNIYDERATVCIESKKMAAVDSAKAELEGKGNFVAKFNRAQFDALKDMIYFQNDAAEEIEVLGWQSAHGVYAFANGIFDGKMLYQVDTFGIAHTPKGKFYIPAFSSVNENGAALFANERKFSFEPGKLNLSKWSSLINQVYGDNGKVGIAFVIAAVFRDFIFQVLDSFPMLFLFAPPQSGKSTFRDSFLSLFGVPQTPISLESASSPKGFARKLAQFCNALIVFEEYKNNVGNNLIGMLKSLYDGIGYERAQATNDNKTHSTPVLSGVMLVGQQVPTKENALFTRVLMLELNRQKWTPQEKKVLDTLKFLESEGLGTVLLQILQYRQYVEQNFKKAFDTIFQKIRAHTNLKNITDRHIQNAAAILAPFKLISEKESFAFSYEEIFEFLAKRLKEQHEMMSRNNEINQFWEAFHTLRNDGRLYVDKHFKYGEEKGQKLLYLIIQQVHPVYNEYMTKQGGNTLDLETLLRYLKQQTYFVTPQQLDTTIKQSTDCKKVGWNSRRAYMFKADDEPIIGE